MVQKEQVIFQHYHTYIETVWIDEQSWNILLGDNIIKDIITKFSYEHFQFFLKYRVEFDNNYKTLDHWLDIKFSC